MASKRSHWQSFWQIDQATGLAVHDIGLRVRLVDKLGVPENPDEVVAVLAAQHGAHNAPLMVQRLVREGAQLLIDPNARGWRG